MLLDSVRALADEAHRVQTPRNSSTALARFPWDNVAAINALGLNAMFVPGNNMAARRSPYTCYLACGARPQPRPAPRPASSGRPISTR